MRRLPSIVVSLLLVGCAGSVPAATATQRARVRVVMYTTAWCPVCASARSWLHARGIPFTERDVERDPSAAAMFRRLSRERVVPVIDVEGDVLVGFVPSELRQTIDRHAHRAVE